MAAINVVRALAVVDAKSVARDSLLRAMIFVPLGLAAAARWVFPPALARIGALLDIDLLSVYPQFMGYVILLLAPVICSLVVGFLLLDQRDDQTLRALQVTPLSLQHYLMYRLAMPMLLSVLLTLVALPLSGLAHLRPLPLLAVVLVAAPVAPIMALFLGAFAANKVQGFALQKALGVLLVAPALAAFTPMPWRLLLGFVPTYWPAAFFWEMQASSAGAWRTLAVGLAYHALLLVLLTRRLIAVVHR